MNKLSDRSFIEAEVTRIADELVKLGNRDAKGLYWKTPNSHAPGEMTESIDLFNGNAGIILFFLAIYRYKKKQEYLQTALEAAGRLLQHEQVLHPQYYTFYGGATGILYVCIQLYKATGQTYYLQKALQLEQQYRPGYNNRVTQYDLLSGQAGILLAVLHLYACTKEPSLLRSIEEIINKLITGAHPGRTGLKWDTNKHGYDSLTGFSHGASGIAFSLLQTAHFFHAPGLQYLATQAFEYESNYYDPHTGNYMDLRVGAARMTTIREQYNDKLHDWPLATFTPTMSGISSWAHGAAGCAISRLFAYKITGDQLSESKAALDYSWLYFQQQKQIDYSLCSGYGGIAASFMLAAQILHQPVWQTRALTIAGSAIEFHDKEHTYNSKIQHTVPDCGLFSGLAGVGYWLLGCLQPLTTDNIIHPALDVSCDVPNAIQEKFSVEEIKAQIKNRYHPELVTGLWRQHTGFLQFRQRRLLIQQRFESFEQLTDTQWLKQHFITANHIELINVENEQTPLLYYCHETGISHMPVSKFTGTLLQHFRKSEALASVAALIHEALFNNEDKKYVEERIIEQVKELVKAGFLISN